ncbi:hypothetical protein [Microbacterium saperdae]|uniref:Uncharacterized protein n=1 Tax=Microbacterium saperdae TaxID=69368 RepID=A0A543BBQ6_9MICO|nr:hypothetical protein [Microbacterium saperdae]TQL82279.1 hypothetical protein FB560_3763 [Microbacterium saperdae]GGM38537.1 hypothetical protein GCM10010489_06970 [Microbacterium saperdae]
MRRWQAAALGALLVIGLSGCAAPAVDPDAVQEWLAQQESVEVPGALGSMSAQASTADDVMGENGVTLTFDTPQGITEIVFSCFGPEKMDVDVTTGAVDTDPELAHGIRTEGLVCADSPHTIERVQDAATKVLIDGLSADGQGAWSAFVVGEE